MGKWGNWKPDRTAAPQIATRIQRVPFAKNAHNTVFQRTDGRTHGRTDGRTLCGLDRLHHGIVFSHGGEGGCGLWPEVKGGPSTYYL